MKKFVGDINIFLNALGEKQGSNLILKAISIVATDFEVEYFECDNIQHTYFHFFKRGVDFVFSKNNDSEFLESIFFYVNKYNNEYYEYPFLEQLFLELDNKFTQNDLIVKFGKPEAYSDNWIRYSINNNSYNNIKSNYNCIWDSYCYFGMWYTNNTIYMGNLQLFYQQKRN